MSNLLLPYAYDCNNNLVHINNAQKGEKYVCPNCGAEVILKKSRIPEGQKYHRKDHFAHKSNSDNHCSESFLHKLFKDKCVDFIKDKIANGDELRFEWFCDQCNEKHEGNLLKKATDVVSEYDLGICRPDIALLDKSGEVIIVIEIVVTHKPTPKTMQYYKDNNIACLLINVTDFDDCENIGHKLSNPDEVNICSNPKCERCGNNMYPIKIVIIPINCYKCKKEMNYAIISTYDTSKKIKLIGPSKFSADEINIANSLGANIAISNNHYDENICPHCNTGVSESFIDVIYKKPHKEEVLVYKCLKCTNNERGQQKLAKNNVVYYGEFYDEQAIQLKFW